MFEPMEIIDNFLESSTFSELQNVFLGSHFPWYFNNGVNQPSNKNNLDDYQFTHKIFEDSTVHSDVFDLVRPILSKLSIKSLVRVKANLSVKTKDLSFHGMHTDTTFDCTTAIFYLNTNNGQTLVDDSKVDSIENRLVTFNSQIMHAGSTTTDTQTRVVLNLNYF